MMVIKRRKKAIKAGGNAVDLTGKVFGRLTVIALSGFTPDRSTIWLCQCRCGRFVFKQSSRLTSGVKVRSCGCLHREVIGRKGHGEVGTRIYNIWGGMKARCADKKNKKYGGRGIRVCEEWQEYLQFKAWAVASGYSDSLSIDRIDNDGDYTPANCRWATPTEQANNRRSSVFLSHNGERKTIAEWGRDTGIPEGRIRLRISRYGWSVERALAEKGAA